MFLEYNDCVREITGFYVIMECLDLVVKLSLSSGPSR